MELSLLHSFIIAGGVYITSRVVSFYDDSNKMSMKKRKEQERLKSLAKLYGRDS